MERTRFLVAVVIDELFLLGRPCTTGQRGTRSPRQSWGKHPAALLMVFSKSMTIIHVYPRLDMIYPKSLLYGALQSNFHWLI